MLLFRPRQCSHVDLDPVETIELIHKGFTAETNEIIQRVHLLQNQDSVSDVSAKDLKFLNHWH